MWSARDRIRRFPGENTHMGQEPTNQTGVHPRVARGVDALMSVQRPVVLAHLRQIRRQHPQADPDQLTRILERRYLTAITTSGAAVGAASVVPAVGVGASLALSGVETVAFLEATALLAQSVSELHGIALDDPDRARLLVMGMVLGTGGSELILNLATQVTRTGASRSAFWGALVARNLPQAAIGPAADQLKSVFLRRFASWTSGTAIGRLAPFGIGAVIGGAGNMVLGRQVIRASRLAFGPPPPAFPLALDVGPAPEATTARRTAGRILLAPALTVVSITRVPRARRARKAPSPPEAE